MMSALSNGKTILVTGGARRVGKIFTPTCTRAGADVVIHHGHSDGEAKTRATKSSDGKAKPDIRKSVPTARWAEESEVEQALLVALTSPDYIMGKIIHLDGSRYLV